MSTKKDMNSIRPEDLGSMGESFFNTLCKSVGFIANSSKSDDKGGWDFEVEQRQTTDINYSNHSYPVYRVQVKSTSGKSCAKITFGNLLKLIQYNGASFIVLIKYSESISIGNTNPEKVYLLHIDEKFSLSILKEAREKQLKSNEFALNKDKKTISFKNENEIDKLDGIGLKNYIDKCIGGSYLKYTENKLTYLSSFEKEGRKQLSICTMDTMKDAESMANCFLGYPEKFKINIKEFYAPFGIMDNNPTSIFTHYGATITPHHDKLPNFTVCLGISKFGKQYKFTGTLYFTPEIEWLPRKLKVKCNLFNIIIELNSMRMAGEIFPNDIDVEFKQLYKKFCDINIENNIISTRYIFDNIKKLNLFSVFGEEYDPYYFLELKDSKNCTLEDDTAIFSFTILFEEIKLVTFVAFYGSIEKENKNTLRCHFEKSEILDNFILSNTDDREGLVKEKSEYFKYLLDSKGCKVLL